MAFLAYCRVSTRPQVEGDSLEVQERQVRGRALQEGQELAHVYIERGVSGSRPLDERPQGRELLNALRPGDTLIAPKLDRIWRSATDALSSLEWFKKRGIRLILLDVGEVTAERGVGSLLFGVLAAVAQFEKERNAERVRDMKQHEKEQGKYRGGRVPLGYRVGEDKTLVPDPTEQAVLALALRLSGEGKSLRRIQQAVSESLGFKMSHMAISRIIRDARIAPMAV